MDDDQGTIGKIKSESDVDDAAHVDKCRIIDKPKKQKRKRIRRLVSCEEFEKTDFVRRNRFKRILMATAVIVFSIALFMNHYYGQNNSKTNQILKQFFENYRNQYAEIVHGKRNYCDQKLFETEMLTRIIKQKDILHQEQAMRQIEVALSNESDLNVIVLVGPVGVGKTLFLSLLQKHFPWQDNIHTYSWNKYGPDEAEKFKVIRELFKNLSNCGFNLVIIENMQVFDYDAVALINQMLLEVIKNTNQRVVLFYVFSLNTMLSAEEYTMGKNLLQSLPDCKVINFISFTKHELRDCIQREANIENLLLSKEDQDEIVETIDPFISGCKNVNAKVLMYGTPEININNY